MFNWIIDHPEERAMETLVAIAKRRSIKKFDSEHRLTAAEIERLMETVILSPTAYNIQNWRFVVITDADQKQEMRDIGWNQEQFSHCSALIIVCGDRNAYDQETERYWAHAPAETRDMLVGMIKQNYGANPAAQRDENLPAEHDIIMAVAVGKALEPARERGGQLPMNEVVRKDSF